MSDCVYAKAYKKYGTQVTESLEEHTKALLSNLDILKKHYKNEIDLLGVENIWELLKIASIYHDLGKVSDEFQNKIKKVIKESQVKTKSGLKKEIPHNYLSIAFFSFIKNIDDFPADEYDALLYSVAYHHDREMVFDEEQLLDSINKDLKTKVNQMEWVKEFGLEPNDKLMTNYFSYLNNSESEPNTFKNIKRKKIYVLLKGLLHRLDHSASGHVEVEEERISDVKNKLIEYIKVSTKGKFNNLKPFQEKAYEYRDKSILLIASTGMGKTEFALNWAGEDKAFYVLPLKVSVNAIYERIKDIFNTEDHKIGLLHGDSLFYGIDDLSSTDDKELKEELSEDKLSMEEHINRVNLSKQFSMPLTVTTADQLFTSVFKWRGYEKIYATLMYSKIILDEPQSYSPEILAMIIKCLQEISDLGGKFCFMSATIHPLIINNLEKYCDILEPVYNEDKKHKIELREESIDNLVQEIPDQYNNKILIIVNTVKKAQDIYKLLEYKENVHLLHSGFIQNDRKLKEKNIINDYKKDEPVIWISTQIVEASLDIDYDILYSEIATLDALIQRMGRINRRGLRSLEDTDESNIIISTAKPSDNYYIYDKDIVGFTIEALHEYDNKILLERQKQELMNIVFDDKRPNIDKIKFFNIFKETLKILKDGFEANNKSEAQKAFRNITNVNVIPKEIFVTNESKIYELIDKIKNKNTEREKRLKAINTLNGFTLSLPYHKTKDKITLTLPIDKGRIKNQLFVLEAYYNDEIGISFKDKLKVFSEFI